MARKRRPNRPDSRRVRAPVIRTWRWRTLPVWLALTGGFVAGWYVSALGVGRQPDSWSYFVLLAVLGGFSVGLSQITRYLMERWMVRRKARTAATAATTARSAPPSKGPRTPA